MHELSLAQSLVGSVIEEVKKHGAKRAIEIDVSIGELMQLDRDIFVEALGSIMTDPALKGAKLEVNVEKAVFSCGKCGSKWGMDEASKQLADIEDDLLVLEPDSKELPLHFLPELYPAFVRCPKCGSSDILLSQGGTVKLKKLVLRAGE
jgi:hydrogenase nickel incorporation protein HypA/HybF